MRYGLAAPHELAARSGFELLRAMIAGELPQPPVYATLGLLLEEVGHGRAVIAATPQLAHYNPMGSVHGGIYATLLDSAVGCAVHSTLVAGEAYTTLELKVNYIKALRVDAGPVRAEGRVLHRGRTIAIAEASLVDLSGCLYAHATTTCLITR